MTKSSWKLTAKLVIVFTLIAIGGSLSNAFGATFIVTNTNDGGPGSLRQAIADAAVNQQHDSIQFDSIVFSTPQTIVLTTGELVVLRDLNPQAGVVYNLTIVGPAPSLLTLDANNQSRIFRTEDGNYTFTLVGATLKRGFGAYGGAVYARNHIIVTNAVITESVATGEQLTPGGFLAGVGGGIYADGITISDSVISNNTANGIVLVSQNPGVGDAGIAAAGGGIFIRAGGTRITNCIFSGNSARGASSPAAGDNRAGAQGGWGYGGAVYSPFNATIINSTFVENSAIAGNGASGGSGGNGGGAYGGAVVVSGGRIFNSSFSGNSASAGAGGNAASNPSLSGNGGESGGGGIYELGNGTMANVTISGNTATAGNGRLGGKGFGGGLRLGNQQWNIVNFTVAGNAAVGGVGAQGNGASEGGGIHSAFESVPPTPNFRNNLVAGNTASAGTDVFGVFPNASSNLIRNGEGSTGLTHGVNGNLVGTTALPIEPLIGPLANNGGVTNTRALLDGSPAVNAGNNSVFIPSTSNPLTYDQRNFQRIVAGTIDIGAYEFGAPTITISPSVPDLLSTTDTGSSNTDNITNATDLSFNLMGLIEGAHVELLRNGIPVSGGFPTTSSMTLSDVGPPAGLTQYTVRQTVGTFTSNESSTLTVTIDRTGPTGTLNQGPTQADPTRVLPVVFRAVFSEPVAGFSGSDISLAGSTADVGSAFVNATNVGGGITWDVGVSAITSNGGFVIANITAGSYQDIAGNNGTASTGTDNSVTVDNVRPSVTVNQSVSQNDPTSSQPIVFTAAFSEAVSGFVPTDVSLAGSTADILQALIDVTGGPSIYTVSVSNVRSSGTVRVTIPANAAQDTLGNLSLASTSTDNTVTFNLRRPVFDFDGDGKTDVGIFRQAVGEWWINQSSNGATTAGQFGSSSDIITPADITGDGKTDIAFFQPSSGFWFVLRSEDFSYFAFPFGTNGDVPAPADYDGDGKADATVFRPSSSTWFIQRSTDGGATIAQFGSAGDVPVPADYDGDGKADIAIYRPSLGQWWVQRSTAGILVLTFGDSNDKPVQGDFTGDGKADIAFWRPSTGEWFISRSEDLSYYSFPFGSNGDIPAPGDYDGDGKVDPTVFRPSQATWYSQRSTAGILIQQFGANGDRPIPNAFVP